MGERYVDAGLGVAAAAIVFVDVVEFEVGGDAGHGSGDCSGRVSLCRITGRPKFLVSASSKKSIVGSQPVHHTTASQGTVLVEPSDDASTISLSCRATGVARWTLRIESSSACRYLSKGYLVGMSEMILTS